MKKILVIMIMVLLFVSGCTNNNDIKTKNNKVKTEERNNYVSYNGYLKVKNSKLVNDKNEEFRLRGISSHGLQWFGNLITDENIKILKNEWKSNVFRLAMYTDEGGYISNKSIKDDLEKYIKIIVDNDMYVIVDWHILHDNDPNINKKEALDFFDYMSKKYKNTPNVIYEICNEPNGEEVTWNNHIKPYAEDIIKVIKKNNNKALIIVGTPNWSNKITDVIGNEIEEDNIMYSFHFYAGAEDTNDLRDRFKKAIESKLPVFVSEFGISDPSGNGGVFIDSAKEWMDILDKNNISYVNWSLANKDESSAMLKPGVKSISDDGLSESGKFIKEQLLMK